MPPTSISCDRSDKPLPTDPRLPELAPIIPTTAAAPVTRGPLRVERDRVAAVVEVLAGPHRLVSLMTAEAATELGLKVGDRAACVVKATNVVVEVARRGRASS